MTIPFFYGGYDKEVVRVSAFGSAVKFNYNLPLAYFFTTIGCLVFSLSVIIHK